jgi:DNA (cytosine-5)-methyltransferase 1
MSTSYDVTAIFGGIGGLEVGLHLHGHRTSLFCECDPEAVSVLMQRFPGVPVVTDIRRTEEILAAISPRSDLLTAGFPCTDLSQAGLTQGFSGGRSSLIRDTISLLEKRPFPNVLIENVPNWRHLHGGAYLREVLGSLEILGFRWAYRTIDARAFGVPQRRHRIFVFATADGDPRDVLFHGDHHPDDRAYPLEEAAHGFYWTEGNRGLGWGEDCVPTLKGGSAIGIPAPPAVLMPDLSIVTPSVEDGERLQGFDAGWTDLEHVAQGVGGGRFNSRKRWHLVGNAVSVDVSGWIGERLAERASVVGDTGDVPLAPGQPWPAAAWFDGKRRWASKRGTWPVRRPMRPLANFLSRSVSPLSLRATAGFFDRISKSRLSFKPGFKTAVENHLRRMSAQAHPTLHRWLTEEQRALLQVA